MGSHLHILPFPSESGICDINGLQSLGGRGGSPSEQVLFEIPFFPIQHIHSFLIFITHLGLGVQPWGWALEGYHTAILSAGHFQVCVPMAVSLPLVRDLLRSVKLSPLGEISSSCVINWSQTNLKLHCSGWLSSLLTSHINPSLAPPQFPLWPWCRMEIEVANQVLLPRPGTVRLILKLLINLKTSIRAELNGLAI